MNNFIKVFTTDTIMGETETHVQYTGVLTKLQACLKGRQDSS